MSIFYYYLFSVLTNLLQYSEEVKYEIRMMKKNKEKLLYITNLK